MEVLPDIPAHRRALRRQPALNGLIVVGPGVHHAVMFIAVGKVLAVPALGVEGKLQHLHAGVARAAQQGAHRVGEEAQVLGNDLPSAQRPVHRFEEVQAGAGLPPPVSGGLVAVRDGVVLVKAPEVVDAQHVEQPELKTDAPQPPAVAILFHHLPVKQGIAPQLAIGRERVRRTARHLHRRQLLVQLELLGDGPHVGAVQRHIDGQVADDGNALPIRPRLQRVPLGKK